MANVKKCGNDTALHKAKEAFSKNVAQSFNNTEKILECILEFLDKIEDFSTSCAGSRINVYAVKESLLEIEKLLEKKKLFELFIKTHISNVFDIILESLSKPWSKKQILLFFNGIIQNVNESTKTEILSTLNPYYVCRLVDFLGMIGSYELQATVLETLFRVYGSDFLKKNIKTLLPESSDLSQSFLSISPENFEEGIREFLNTLNENTEKLFSISAESIFLDELVFEKPMNSQSLWVDFNLIDYELTWYGGGKYLSNLISKNIPNNDGDQWELITVDLSDIGNLDVYSTQSSEFTVSFQLKGSCSSYNNDFYRLLNKRKCLKMIFSTSEKCNKLLNVILPSLFKSKIVNHTRLSDFRRSVYKPIKHKSSKEIKSRDASFVGSLFSKVAISDSNSSSKKHTREEIISLPDTMKSIDVQSSYNSILLSLSDSDHFETAPDFQYDSNHTPKKLIHTNKKMPQPKKIPISVMPIPKKNHSHKVSAPRVITKVSKRPMLKVSSCVASKNKLPACPRTSEDVIEIIDNRKVSTCIMQVINNDAGTNLLQSEDNNQLNGKCDDFRDIVSHIGKTFKVSGPLYEVNKLNESQTRERHVSVPVSLLSEILKEYKKTSISLSHSQEVKDDSENTTVENNIVTQNDINIGKSKLKTNSEIIKAAENICKNQHENIDSITYNRHSLLKKNVGTFKTNVFDDKISLQKDKNELTMSEISQHSTPGKHKKEKRTRETRERKISSRIENIDNKVMPQPQEDLPEFKVQSEILTQMEVQTKHLPEIDYQNQQLHATEVQIEQPLPEIKEIELFSEIEEDEHYNIVHPREVNHNVILERDVENYSFHEENQNSEVKLVKPTQKDRDTVVENVYIEEQKQVFQKEPTKSEPQKESRSTQKSIIDIQDIYESYKNWGALTRPIKTYSRKNKSKNKNFNKTKVNIEEQEEKENIYIRNNNTDATYLEHTKSAEKHQSSEKIELKIQSIEIVDTKEHNLSSDKCDQNRNQNECEQIIHNEAELEETKAYFRKLTAKRKGKRMVLQDVTSDIVKQDTSQHGENFNRKLEKCPVAEKTVDEKENTTDKENLSVISDRTRKKSKIPKPIRNKDKKTEPDEIITSSEQLEEMSPIIFAEELSNNEKTEEIAKDLMLTDVKDSGESNVVPDTPVESISPIVKHTNHQQVPDKENVYMPLVNLRMVRSKKMKNSLANKNSGSPGEILQQTKSELVTNILKNDDKITGKETAVSPKIVKDGICDSKTKQPIVVSKVPSIMSTIEKLQKIITEDMASEDSNDNVSTKYSPAINYIENDSTPQETVENIKAFITTFHNKDNTTAISEFDQIRDIADNDKDDTFSHTTEELPASPEPVYHVESNISTCSSDIPLQQLKLKIIRNKNIAKSPIRKKVNILQNIVIKDKSEDLNLMPLDHKKLNVPDENLSPGTLLVPEPRESNTVTRKDVLLMSYVGPVETVDMQQSTQETFQEIQEEKSKRECAELTSNTTMGGKKMRKLYNPDDITYLESIDIATENNEKGEQVDKSPEHIVCLKKITEATTNETKIENKSKLQSGKIKDSKTQFRMKTEGKIKKRTKKHEKQNEIKKYFQTPEFVENEHHGSFSYDVLLTTFKENINKSYITPDKKENKSKINKALKQSLSNEKVRRRKSNKLFKPFEDNLNEVDEKLEQKNRASKRPYHQDALDTPVQKLPKYDKKKYVENDVESITVQDILDGTEDGKRSKVVQVFFRTTKEMAKALLQDNNLEKSKNDVNALTDLVTKLNSY